SSGGADLHDVGTVFDDFTGLVMHSRNAVRCSLGTGMPLEGKKIVVAMSARNAERGPAHQHSRSGHKPLVNRVTKSHIAISAGSYVANGSEAGFERDLRVARAPKLLHWL